MNAVLTRLDANPQQTIGRLQLFVDNEELYECKTIELPWNNNQRNISCIPTGEYIIQKHISPKFGKSFHVLNVPNRSEILIHKGNFNRDTRGCILPGINFGDIDGDGLVDVTSSGIAMEHLWEATPDQFTLKVK